MIRLTVYLLDGLVYGFVLPHPETPAVFLYEFVATFFPAPPPTQGYRCPMIFGNSHRCPYVVSLTLTFNTAQGTG